MFFMNSKRIDACRVTLALALADPLGMLGVSRPDGIRPSHFSSP